jgi:tRNA-dihydrouridine synthase
MKIGNHTLRHGLFLGPMAGYTDYGMREICKRFGAEYLVTEMVSAKGLYYGGSKKQWDTIVLGPGNHDLTSATIHYNS